MTGLPESAGRTGIVEVLVEPYRRNVRTEDPCRRDLWTVRQWEEFVYQSGIDSATEGATKVVFLEATPSGLEQRLATLLAEQTGIARDAHVDLAALFQQIRRRRLLSGSRIVIVLDQFEQWLNGRSDLSREPLVDTLRQCDGESLTCLILVRDDFWMAVSQFMLLLEWQIQEGSNALVMPQFDKRHARRVLAAYGRALGALPSGPLEESQKQFIQRAVTLLDESGNLIPIHLVMFAQMMDPEKWQLAELKRLGGWQGIGLAFLDNLFADRRLIDHESTCRRILEAMLPQSDTAIKGAHKTLSELREHCGTEITTARLAQIVDLMDREFRIITPTETSSGQPAWQLAHDSLVTPLRIWLAQREQSTWQGRARSRLRMFSRQWETSMESRFFPAWYEYLPMCWATFRRVRSLPERRFLKAAGRRFFLRSATLAAVILTLGMTSNGIWRQSHRALTANLFHQMIEAPPGAFMARMELLKGQDPEWVRSLAAGNRTVDWTRTRHVRQLLAQTWFGAASDTTINNLVQDVRGCPDSELTNVIRTLRWAENRRAEPVAIRILESSFESGAYGQEEKMRLAIVAWHLGQPRWAAQMTRISADPDMRETFIEQYPSHHDPWGTLPACWIPRCPIIWCRHYVKVWDWFPSPS